MSPKRLGGPAPGREVLDTIIDAGLRAPDHGGLRPWRLLEFDAGSRPALADLFEDEKKRRDPLASTDDLARAREHALHAPVVWAFIVCVRRQTVVPVHEQWLAAGAALDALQLAAHAFGLGAIVLSGERCQDQAIRTGLGVCADELLAGFISIGTITKAPAAAQLVNRSRVWTTWVPSNQGAHHIVSTSKHPERAVFELSHIGSQPG